MAERLVMMIVVGARSGQQPLVYFISHSSACNAETDLTSVTIILQCFYSCISTMYKHSCRHRYREPLLILLNTDISLILTTNDRVYIILQLRFTVI